jgi:hypothetical protein
MGNPLAATDLVLSRNIASSFEGVARHVGAAPFYWYLPNFYASAPRSFVQIVSARFPTLQPTLLSVQFCAEGLEVHTALRYTLPRTAFEQAFPAHLNLLRLDHRRARTAQLLTIPAHVRLVC